MSKEKKVVGELVIGLRVMGKEIVGDWLSLLADCRDHLDYLSDLCGCGYPACSACTVDKKTTEIQKRINKTLGETT